MSDVFWQGIGAVAAVLTSTSFLPQIWRGYRIKSLHDLSWGMLGTFGIGVFCWLLYGLFRRDPILIGANAFTFSNVAVLCAMKYGYAVRERRSASAPDSLAE